MLQTAYGTPTARAGAQILSGASTATLYRPGADATHASLAQTRKQGLSLMTETASTHTLLPNAPVQQVSQAGQAIQASQLVHGQGVDTLNPPQTARSPENDKGEFESLSLNPIVVAARKAMVVQPGSHGQAASQHAPQLGEYQLNPIEAFRFLAIIDEGREKLELVGRLIAENSRRRDATNSSDQQRRDIVNLMRNQKQLEAQFEELMKLREVYRHSSNKNAAAQNERAIEAVFHQLQHSSNSIALYLRDQPSTQGGNAEKLWRDYEDLKTELDAIANDLRNLTYSRLVESIHARDSRRTALDDMRKQQETRAVTIAQLQDDLRSVLDRHRRETEKAQQSIALKTAAIKSTRKINNARKQYEEATVEAEQEAAERIQRNRLMKLQKEMFDLIKEIEETRLTNEKLTSFWSKQHDVLNSVKKDWEEKFDKDTRQQEGLHERLLSVRNAQRAQLDELTIRWEHEVEEKRQRLEQLKQRIIENEARKQLEEKMHHAQRVIRFYWRLYRRRKEAAKKKKKRAANAKKNSSGPSQPVSTRR